MYNAQKSNKGNYYVNHLRHMSCPGMESSSAISFSYFEACMSKRQSLRVTSPHSIDGRSVWPSFGIHWNGKPYCLPGVNVRHRSVQNPSWNEMPSGALLKSMKNRNSYQTNALYVVGTYIVFDQYPNFQYCFIELSKLFH